jgi:hypothetical protein
MDLLRVWRAAGLATDIVDQVGVASVAADGLRDRVDLSLRRRNGEVILGLHVTVPDNMAPERIWLIVVACSNKSAILTQP